MLKCGDLTTRASTLESRCQSGALVRFQRNLCRDARDVLTLQRFAALLALYAAVYGFAPRFSNCARAYCMHSRKKLICPRGGSICKKSIQVVKSVLLSNEVKCQFLEVIQAPTQFHAHDATSRGVSRSLSSGTSIYQKIGGNDQIEKATRHINQEKRVWRFLTCCHEIFVEEEDRLKVEYKWYRKQTS